MIVYYITYGDDGGVMELGTDNGFGVFWTGQGMRVLMNMVEKYPEKLEKTIIKNHKNEQLSVGQFLENIEKLKVRTQ
mgnify:FL=1